jgi:hypothetical protein
MAIGNDNVDSKTPSSAGISDFLYRPVDIAPLVVFRVMMGILMAAEGFGAILTGWVRSNYVDPPFSFNFICFDFLQVLAGPQAYVVYVMLGIAGLSIAAGYRYRLSVAVYTLLWAAVYLGQKTSYNNHYYLLLLMCLLLFIVPAQRAVSLDVKQGRAEATNVVPFWSKWVFKMLLLIVYTYAAIAKLYPDWLDGTTTGIFLSSKAQYPIIGGFAGEYWLIMLIAYGGIIFDFLVVPALWYRPTRVYAFVVSIGFHAFNSAVFEIGIFPYMMLICTVLYFDEALIRRIFFRRQREFPGKTPLQEAEVSSYLWPSPFGKKALEGFLLVFFALMVLLPLRPFYFPGSPHWSEEGHRLSWHMMLRSKSGTVAYTVEDASGKVIARISPSEELPSKMARSMATRPDMIWQYAQRLKTRYEADGYTNLGIYARSHVSLNGRPYRPLIDPEANLAEVQWSHIAHNPWILLYSDL